MPTEKFPHLLRDAGVPGMSRRIVLGGLVAASGSLAAIPPSEPQLRHLVNAAEFGVQADGATDDAPALLRAVSALTDGSVLALPAGVIALGSPGWSGIALRRLRGISLQGNGAVLKWLAIPGQATGPFGKTGLLLHECHGAHISDLKIDGNGVNCIGLGLDTCKSCTVSDVEAYAHGGNQVGGLGQLVSCRGIGNSWLHCTARDSIPGSQYRGFYLGNGNVGWGETDLRILGCSALSNDATGFAIGAVRLICTASTSTGNAGAGFISGTSAGSPSIDHLFVGNVAQRNGFHGWQTDVYGPNAERIVLSGNNFSHNTFCGALCHKGTEVSICDNILADNGAGTGSGAIEISQSNDVIVSNNHIRGDMAHGICIKTAFPGNELSRVSISNNRCTGSVSKTVWLDAIDASSALRSIVFSANIVDGGRHGLSLVAAAGAQIDDVIIADNIVDRTSDASYLFSTAVAGQSSKMRLTGNAGGRADIGPMVMPGADANNCWNVESGRALEPPRHGEWRRGAVVYNAAPSPGAPLGWVCTQPGTPGSWHGFGLIAE
jgi:hypothetical protein